VSHFSEKRQNGKRGEVPEETKIKKRKEASMIPLWERLSEEKRAQLERVIAKRAAKIRAAKPIKGFYPDKHLEGRYAKPVHRVRWADDFDRSGDF
jgi:hypothetical protein